jgi:predicted RNA-binding protein YlqC (UPF0109 family)
MKELVQFFARQLVNNPDAVEVKETKSDTASVLELRVAKDDLGTVIGRQGRTVKSMRILLSAVGARTKRNRPRNHRKGVTGIFPFRAKSPKFLRPAIPRCHFACDSRNSASR